MKPKRFSLREADPDVIYEFLPQATKDLWQLVNYKQLKDQMTLLKFDILT